MRINKTKMNLKTFFFMISSSLLQNNGGNVDGFVKSPSAALRFNFVFAAHL
jgi:hypothetical protein